MHLPHRMILIDGTDHFCSLRPPRVGEDEEVVEPCLVHSRTHRRGDGGAEPGEDVGLCVNRTEGDAKQLHA